jgi:hypothetical protein
MTTTSSQSVNIVLPPATEVTALREHGNPAHSFHERRVVSGKGRHSAPR